MSLSGDGNRRKFVDIKGKTGTVSGQIAAQDGIEGKMILGMFPGTTVTILQTINQKGNVYVQFSLKSIKCPSGVPKPIQMANTDVPENLWIIASMKNARIADVPSSAGYEERLQLFSTESVKVHLTDATEQVNRLLKMAADTMKLPDPGAIVLKTVSAEPPLQKQLEPLIPNAFGPFAESPASIHEKLLQMQEMTHCSNWDACIDAGGPSVILAALTVAVYTFLIEKTSAEYRVHYVINNKLQVKVYPDLVVTHVNLDALPHFKELKGYAKRLLSPKTREAVQTAISNMWKATIFANSAVPVAQFAAQFDEPGTGPIVAFDAEFCVEPGRVKEFGTAIETLKVLVDTHQDGPARTVMFQSLAETHTKKLEF